MRKKSHPKLGQHFLTRQEIAGWITDAAEITSNDVVLEIGPGHGILTKELLKRAEKVVAVEKDTTLMAELKNTFEKEVKNGSLVLLNTDIRSFDPATCALLPMTYQVVANIPYYITGEIIRKFLTSSAQPSSMTLLVQKEVAERIVARDGKESLLSLSVKVYGTPRLVKTVKAGSFSPPPKVDSAILAISNISRSHFTTKNQERVFFDILHTAFRSKRKRINSTLGGTIGYETLNACGIRPNARPENISLTQWLLLKQHLAHRVLQPR